MLVPWNVKVEVWDVRCMLQMKQDDPYRGSLRQRPELPLSHSCATQILINFTVLNIEGLGLRVRPKTLSPKP